MPNPVGPPLKFPTPEDRQDMWRALCDHVASGYSMKSFPLCDEDTFYKYMKDYPDDCPKEKLDEAKRKSMHLWERLGMGGATGKIKDFNAPSWIFNMKNRFGWRDKMDVTSDEKPLTVFVPAFGESQPKEDE